MILFQPKITVGVRLMKIRNDKQKNKKTKTEENIWIDFFFC